MFIHVNRPQTYTFVFDGAKQKQKTILQNDFAIIIRFFSIFYPNAFLTTCKVSPLRHKLLPPPKQKPKLPPYSQFQIFSQASSVPLVPNITNRHTTQTKYPPPCLMPTRDTPSYRLSKSYDMSYFVECFDGRSTGSVGSFFCYAVEKLFVRRVLLYLFADRLSVSYDICG